MAAAATIFIFWASFFMALSVKEWWESYRDPVAGRLGHAFLRPKDPVQDLVIPVEELSHNEPLKKTLLHAGLRRKSDLKRVRLLKRACLIVPGLIASSLFFLLDLPAEKVLLLGGLFFTIFVLIPRLFLLRIIFKRRKEIEKNLAEALDLLILCLEAGISFDSALVRVAQEGRRISTHLSRELTSAYQEIQVGKSREEALRNLAERCGVEDMKALVGAILQSIKLGTSLVRTLKIQATALRKKRRERIRAQILKTPVKLIFPLIFFIFPTLLMVVLGPSLVEIFRHLDDVRM